jgi:hypothetical protein
MVFADDHLDVDAEVVLVAEHFEDAALRWTRGRGPVGDLYVDDESLQIIVMRRGASFRAEDAMGRRVCGRRNFEAERDGDGLGHAFVERDDEVGALMIASGVMENADDGRVATLEDTENASGAAIVATAEAGRSEFDEHLIALHGAAHFAGRDEDVLIDGGARSGGGWIGANKAVAVAMEIEFAGDEIVTPQSGQVSARRFGFGGRSFGDRPAIAVGLHQLALAGEAAELLAEQTALLASAQAQLAYQLLIASAAVGQALDVAEQFAVVHC